MSEDIVKTISRHILRVQNVIVKMVVPLIDKETGADLINDSAKEMPNDRPTEHSIYLEHFPFVVIEIKNKNLNFLEPRARMVIMTPKTQPVIVKALKHFIKEVFYEREDVFFVREGKTELYSVTEDMITRVYNAGDKNNMLLEPVVITDQSDGTTYEGCRLYLNSSTNSVDLTVDQIESLYYTLSKIDIFMYSQALLNFYIAMNSKTVFIGANHVHSVEKRQNLFKVPGKPEPVEEVTGVVKEKPVDTFAGLGTPTSRID